MTHTFRRHEHTRAKMSGAINSGARVHMGSTVVFPSSKSVKSPSHSLTVKRSSFTHTNNSNMFARLTGLQEFEVLRAERIQTNAFKV